MADKSMEDLIEQMSLGVNDYQTKMSAQFDTFSTGQKALTDRLDAIETKLNTPAKPTGFDKDDDVEEKWTKAYDHYLFTKSGYDELTFIKEFVATHSKKETPDYLKTIAANDLTTGGYWMPITRSNRIIEVVLLTDPLRSVASSVTLTNGDQLQMLGEHGTMPCGWTTEQGARAATANMTLEEKNINTHPMYAMPVMTQKMARLAAFDVEGWMQQKVSKYYAYLEGLAFVQGDATGQPEGIVPAARRTGTAVGQTHTGAAAAITDFDVLIDLQESLPEQYQSSAVWLMNRSTKAYIRKFQDGMGNYMLEPNVQVQYGVNATPQARDMLLGKPIVYVPSMQSVGAAVGAIDRIPIIYGDIGQAYTIVDNPGIYSIRDEITTKGAVSLFTERIGVGGGVVDEAAYVVLECAA